MVNACGAVRCCGLEDTIGGGGIFAESITAHRLAPFIVVVDDDDDDAYERRDSVSVFLRRISLRVWIKMLNVFEIHLSNTHGAM